MRWGARGRGWLGRQSIYTHTQPGYAAGNTHTQDTRTGTAWGYTRAERPAHTVSLVYISEVPWPPPSVTTSYIPLCPPTPPPGRLHLFLLFLLLLPLLLLLLPLSTQAFLICIPLRWHSSPPSTLHPSSPSRPHPPTTPSTQQPPLSVLRGFTHTRVPRPCITRTTRGFVGTGKVGRDKERDHP